MKNNLVVLDAPVDKDVIDFLEQAIASAKAGEVSGILLIEQRKDGRIGYTVAGLQDRLKISGYLYHALHRLQTDN